MKVGGEEGAVGNRTPLYDALPCALALVEEEEEEEEEEERPQTKTV